MTSTGSVFAYSRAAQLQRAQKARALARWCYSQGIGPAVARQDPALLRAAARRAGVPPPHLEPDGTSPTWQLVGQLLSARAEWDRAHGQTPPEHVRCVACAVLEQVCPQCQRPAAAAVGTATGDSSCAGCGMRLDQVLVEHGQDLHPTCTRPVAVPVPVVVDQPWLLPGS